MIKHLRGAIALLILASPGVVLAQGKPLANDQSITVLSGVGFGGLGMPVTPVDAAHPLPVTGDGTPTGTAGSPAAKVVTVQGAPGATPIGVSAVALPLPTGAATAARQDALLTALGAPLQAGGTVDTVIRSTATDRGALVGTTAVTLIPANASRRGFTIQNQSATTSCYANGQTVATADYHSLLIGPGALYETPTHHVGTAAISIICTGAATPIYARDF